MILLNRPQRQAWCGFISKVLVNTGVWRCASSNILLSVMSCSRIYRALQERGPCETVPAYAKVRGYSGVLGFCHK